MLFDKIFQSKVWGCVALFLVASSAIAHHSRAEFEDSFQEIVGEIVDFNWNNPHPSIDLRVPDNSETLQIQIFGSASSLGRAGVSDELFSIGDRVTVVGSYSTRRPNYALGTNMLLVDGREAILTATVGPYWSGEYIGGLEASTANLPQLADTVAENKGLFRVWSSPPDWRGNRQRSINLTEAALAMKAEFDPVDNEISRGEDPGMPLLMFQPSNLELIDHGDFIELDSTYSDTVRRINMIPANPDAEQELSALGYSVGHWEGNDLVVETTRISWAFYFDGAPQSEDMALEERFELSEDQSRLDYVLTVTDPQYLEEPGTLQLFRLAYDITLR